MAIKNTLLGGTDFVNLEPPDADDLNDTFDAASSLIPVGAILPWAKTFHSLDSGTTDSTTANKLVQSGQNFETTVAVGNVIHNTTDDTFAYVTVVDSDTTLTLDSDIMVSGEAYTIYATPALADFFVECNGQTLSDADSIYDGATIYDLNGPADTGLKGMFLRGHTSSGVTETSQNLSHIHTIDSYGNDTGGGYAAEGGGPSGTINSNSSGGTEARPHNTSVVWIMRVK